MAAGSMPRGGSRSASKKGRDSWSDHHFGTIHELNIHRLHFSVRLSVRPRLPCLLRLLGLLPPILPCNFSHLSGMVASSVRTCDLPPHSALRLVQDYPAIFTMDYFTLRNHVHRITTHVFSCRFLVFRRPFCFSQRREVSDERPVAGQHPGAFVLTNLEVTGCVHVVPGTFCDPKKCSSHNSLPCCFLRVESALSVHLLVI